MSKQKTTNELRLQQIKLLDEQVLIQETKCKPCGTNESSVCRNCEVYARLRAIGDTYEKLNLMIRKVKLMPQLTLEQYNELKNQDKPDTFVMSKFGLNSMQLNAWKKKHGLVKPRAAKPNEPKRAPKVESSSLLTSQITVKGLEDKLKREIEALKGEKVVMARKYTQEMEELKVENAKLLDENDRLTADLEKTLAGLEDYQKRSNENNEAKVSVLRDQLQFALIKAREAEEKLVETNQFKLMLMKDYVQMASEGDENWKTNR